MLGRSLRFVILHYCPRCNSILGEEEEGEEGEEEDVLQISFSFFFFYMTDSVLICSCKLGWYFIEPNVKFFLHQPPLKHPDSTPTFIITFRRRRGEYFFFLFFLLHDEIEASNLLYIRPTIVLISLLIIAIIIIILKSCFKLCRLTTSLPVIIQLSHGNVSVVTTTPWNK